MVKKLTLILFYSGLTFLVLGGLLGIFASLGVTPFGQFIELMQSSVYTQEQQKIYEESYVELLNNAVHFVSVYIIPIILLFVSVLASYFSKENELIISITSILPILIAILITGVSAKNIFLVLGCLMLCTGASYTMKYLKNQ